MESGTTAEDPDERMTVGDLRADLERIAAKTARLLPLVAALDPEARLPRRHVRRLFDGLAAIERDLIALYAAKGDPPRI